MRNHILCAGALAVGSLALASSGAHAAGMHTGAGNRAAKTQQMKQGEQRYQMPCMDETGTMPVHQAVKTQESTEMHARQKTQTYMHNDDARYNQ